MRMRRRPLSSIQSEESLTSKGCMNCPFGDSSMHRSTGSSSSSRTGSLDASIANLVMMMMDSNQHIPNASLEKTTAFWLETTGDRSLYSFIATSCDDSTGSRRPRRSRTAPWISISSFLVVFLVAWTQVTAFTVKGVTATPPSRFELLWSSSPSSPLSTTSSQPSRPSTARKAYAVSTTTTTSPPPGADAESYTSSSTTNYQRNLSTIKTPLQQPRASSQALEASSLPILQQGVSTVSTNTDLPFCSTGDSKDRIKCSTLLLDRAYQKRKEEWARKYTSVEGLRRTFGSNRNEAWGDLDATTARRLYKTLLPKALLELYKLGVRPQDLAPLAYQARVSAKLYARERCQLPARVAANIYDGYRQWRRYGSFDTAGMSYQQVWEKYAAVILEEVKSDDALTDEDVTARICLKILERSCETNAMVDRMFLSSKYQNNDLDESEFRDLQDITDTLERDVRRLLQPVTGTYAQKRNELYFAQQKDETTVGPTMRMSSHGGVGSVDADVSRSVSAAATNDGEGHESSKHPRHSTHKHLTPQQFRLLRKLVRIKRRLESISHRIATPTAATHAPTPGQGKKVDFSKEEASLLGKHELWLEHQAFPWNNRKRLSEDRTRNWLHRDDKQTQQRRP